MARNTRASSAARFALVTTALLLPTLSMIPLGGLYLWEKGWLLAWAVGAAICVAVVYAAQSWLFASAASSAVPPPEAAPHPTWSPLEEKAWADVRTIAATVDVDKLNDTAALLDLAHRTVNAVANRIHADKEDAVWRFTMPEALAITERVSGRLNDFIVQNIPFGDRLTVSQALQIYRWRSITGVAERAYNLWRIVRLGNPATAITHEARERLSRAMMQWGREHVSKRLAETFVEEVGRAAIDLYGGRLSLMHDGVRENSASPGDGSGALDMALGPVNVLIVAERSDDRAALRTLISAMEADRAAAVTAFLRGESSNPHFLRSPRLTVNAVADKFIHPPRDAASQTFKLPRFEAGYAAADVLLVMTRAHEGHDDPAGATATAIAASTPSVAPVLLSVTSTPSPGGAAEGGAIESGQTPGSRAKTIQLDMANGASAINRDVLWKAIDALSDDLLRIQLLRRIERTKAGPGWRASGWNATKAAARLTKGLLSRRA